jgi:membrane protein implicated in regulation of membrane protease activity
VTAPDAPPQDADHIATLLIGAVLATAAAIVRALGIGAAAAGIILTVIGLIAGEPSMAGVSFSLLGAALALTVSDFVLSRRARKMGKKP